MSLKPAGPAETEPAAGGQERWTWTERRMDRGRVHQSDESPEEQKHFSSSVRRTDAGSVSPAANTLLCLVLKGSVMHQLSSDCLKRWVRTEAPEPEASEPDVSTDRYSLCCPVLVPFQNKSGCNKHISHSEARLRRRRQEDS